ncbi:MAG: hypothetical protein JRI25_27135 [Deltaproteobacteria bacterium]|nr:hypothetical protein [Deltaproteobacteria bacterium]
MPGVAEQALQLRRRGRLPPSELPVAAVQPLFRRDHHDQEDGGVALPRCGPEQRPVGADLLLILVKEDPAPVRDPVGLVPVLGSQLEEGLQHEVVPSTQSGCIAPLLGDLVVLDLGAEPGVEPLGHRVGAVGEALLQHRLGDHKSGQLDQGEPIGVCGHLPPPCTKLAGRR